jgi:hypothetical protein
MITSQRGWALFLLGMIDLRKTRRGRLGAIYALAFTCACVPASARQSTGSDVPAKATSSSKTQASAATHSTTAKKTTSTAHTSASHSASSKTASTAKRTASRKKKTARVRGQQKIDSERATTIQAALIREHYLTGEPTGNWNDASEDAMRRYQADHGWQTKEVPDARALIRLGLGPDNAHLLNPDSAMTSAPVTPQSSSPAPTSQTAQPVGSPSTQTPAQGEVPPQ